MVYRQLVTLCILSAVLMTGQTLGAEPLPKSLAEALTFYASFDDGTDADFAVGDRRMYTAAELSRKTVVEGEQADQVQLVPQGKWGQSLRFGDKSEQVVFYRGAGNVQYGGPSEPFAGSISLWMSLHPDEDLAPGYVDPLQITDKQWNNACLFLDFTKDERPRHFRLGVFADYAFWNPTDRPWDAIPVGERPMVTVERPPFGRDRWTHVAITFRDFNQGDKPGAATLYLNGEPQGTYAKPQKFSWDPGQLAIILGIYYSGGLDELAIFRRELTAAEVRSVYLSDSPLKALLPNR